MQGFPDIDAQIHIPIDIVIREEWEVVEDGFHRFGQATINFFHSIDDSVIRLENLDPRIQELINDTVIDLGVGTFPLPNRRFYDSVDLTSIWYNRVEGIEMRFHMQDHPGWIDGTITQDVDTVTRTVEVRLLDNPFGDEIEEPTRRQLYPWARLYDQIQEADGRQEGNEMAIEPRFVLDRAFLFFDGGYASMEEDSDDE